MEMPGRDMRQLSGPEREDTVAIAVEVLVGQETTFIAPSADRVLRR